MGHLLPPRLGRQRNVSNAYILSLPSAMLMAMEIDQVETFVAIIRRGGFTRAASSLHLSQPAVSRRLDLLERQLGRPLFDRTRGGRSEERRVGKECRSR